MKRKILSTIAIMLAMSLMLTACGGKTETETSVSGNTSEIAEEEISETNEETEEPTEEVKPTEEPTEEVKPTEEPTPPTHTHSYNSKVTREATCTSNGTITYTCSCGNSYTESTPALGHNWSNSDCTHCKTCSRCGGTEGSALGHDYREHTETIHHPGEYRSVEVCYTCGFTGNASEVGDHLNRTGHTGSYGDVIETEGWDEIITKWICSRCGHCK